MTRILVINPNGTASMTDKILGSCTSVAAAGTHIEAVTCLGAPISIEGYADEATAVPFMLDAIRSAETTPPDAHVIACFDDPGLYAAREVASVPVIGICQAALQTAAIIAARVSVITTLPRSIPIIEDLVARYGARSLCRRVRAIDMPVLALESDAGTASKLLEAAIAAARREDGAEAVILGCAGMSDLRHELARSAGIPVIDGVVAGVKLAEALVGAGYGTSKAGAFATPRSKLGGFSPVTRQVPARHIVDKLDR